MFKKILLRKGTLRVLTMATAVGAPIAYFSTADGWRAVRDDWFPFLKGATAAASDTAAAEAEGEASAEADPVRGVEGAPVYHLAEVLRFDVTIDWILRRWPRVSTGLADLEFQGYRVPLVTGTAETDLAGSLTYYFNPQQQVQRITFRGTTGDARNLVSLLVGRYRFTRKVTDDPGIFLYETVTPSGKPGGELKITMAGVVKAHDPRRRFEVDLMMERAS